MIPNNARIRKLFLSTIAKNEYCQPMLSNVIQRYSWPSKNLVTQYCDLTAMLSPLFFQHNNVIKHEFHSNSNINFIQTSSLLQRTSTLTSITFKCRLILNNFSLVSHKNVFDRFIILNNFSLIHRYPGHTAIARPF